MTFIYMCCFTKKQFCPDGCCNCWDHLLVSFQNRVVLVGCWLCCCSYCPNRSIAPFSNWSTCAGFSTYCGIYVVIELFYWALWILCCLSVAVDFCGLAVINCNVHFVIGDTVFPFKVVWELCWWSWHGIPYYLC